MVVASEKKVTTKQILLVEDDEMAYILFRDALWVHQNGDVYYDVKLARSIKEARSLIFDQTYRPNIIVMGFSLPSMRADGTTKRDIEPSIEFIRAIRAHETLSTIQIVILSRFGDPEFQEKAKEAGADRYIVKGSLMPHELPDVISSV